MLVGAGRVYAVSPRLRGWTCHDAEQHLDHSGFPAPAGMDPAGTRARNRRVWFPRACGDGPVVGNGIDQLTTVSPRLRGWTPVSASRMSSSVGFPAPAGMDLSPSPPRRRKPRFPRACGDGPTAFSIRVRMSWVSPRLRGWTRRADDRGAFLSAPIAELSRSRGPLHYVCPTNSDPCRSHGGRRRPTTHAAPRSSYQSAPKVSRK